MNADSYHRVTISGFSLNREVNIHTLNSVNNIIEYGNNTSCIFNKLVYASPIDMRKRVHTIGNESKSFAVNNLYYNNDILYYPQNGYEFTTHSIQNISNDETIELESSRYFIKYNTPLKMGRNVQVDSIQFKPDNNGSIGISYEIVQDSIESFVHDKHVFAWDVRTGTSRDIYYGNSYEMINTGDDVTVIGYYIISIPYSDIYQSTDSINIHILRVGGCTIKCVDNGYIDTNSCYIFGFNSEQNKYLIGVI